MNDVKNMFIDWQLQLEDKAKSYTSSASMPADLIQKLVSDDPALEEKLSFKPFAKIPVEDFAKELDVFAGLSIVSYLQNINLPGFLTLYRAIRIPTFKRMFAAVSTEGFSVSNYEQERLLSIYENSEYKSERNELKKDSLFKTQVQERIVEGLPVFHYVNDAIQIHNSFRDMGFDSLLLSAIHIPFHLFEENKISLYANRAIDFDYMSKDGDVNINNFVMQDDFKNCSIDVDRMRMSGLNLYESYIDGLPFGLEKNSKLGVKQSFYFLDLYSISGFKPHADLISKFDFLPGFLGDFELFGRRKSEFVPLCAYEVNLE